jgi:hypothetical protein
MSGVVLVAYYKATAVLDLCWPAGSRLPYQVGTNLALEARGGRLFVTQTGAHGNRVFIERYKGGDRTRVTFPRCPDLGAAMTRTSCAMTIQNGGVLIELPADELRLPPRVVHRGGSKRAVSQPEPAAPTGPPGHLNVLVNLPDGSSQVYEVPMGEAFDLAVSLTAKGYRRS